MARPINKKVLDAVITTGASVSIESMGHPYVNMAIIASSVTTGATIKFQGSSDGTNWYDILSASITANGTTENQDVGAHKYLRANVTARTDGTYTVYIVATGFAGVQ
ncbi:MAG: hypothetical protein AB1467_06790 [Candidatus Diapherotrites archaeon]